MKRLRSVVFMLAAGGIGLTLAASATGSTATSPIKVRQTQSKIEALAVDGNRIAYDIGSTLGKNNNKVVVWDVRTGKTITVSGKHTRIVDDSSTGSGVFQLAIAGTRVAWLANVGGNTEGDDYLFSSSVTKPSERKMVTVTRYGDNCAGRSQENCEGDWLGGLVGSGNLIALNRWTTDTNGALASGGLYLLNGTTLKQIGGADTVQATSADKGRVANLSPDGTVNVYSSAGKLLLTIPPSGATSVALSGQNLVELTNTRKLKLYNTQTKSFTKAFSVQGSQKPGNLDVQGNIAIYTVGTSVRAVNLSSGKNRVVGKLSRSIGLARIGAAGLAYSNSPYASKGKLVFVPLARVAAAVS